MRHFTQKGNHGCQLSDNPWKMFLRISENFETKNQGITKVVRTHSLGIMNMSTQSHGNSSNRSQDILASTKVGDWPTEIAIADKSYIYNMTFTVIQTSGQTECLWL